jgi:hypothetical protein
MNKNLISVSIIFFGLCIFLSSWVYSNTLKNIANNLRIEAAAKQPKQEEYRYELIVINENNIIFYISKMEILGGNLLKVVKDRLNGRNNLYHSKK